MKKYLLLAAILSLSLIACSDDSGNGGGTAYTTLEATDTDTISSKRLTGTIGTEKEVDLYVVDLQKANRNVQIKCTQKSGDEDISGNQQTLTLLMQVYEEAADGTLTMISGDHALENSPLPADLKLSIPVDRAKKVYIHIRDLMDNHASDRPYYLSASYETAPDGNDSVDSTETVELAIGGTSATDSIGNVGDTDYFKFDVGAAGVYDVTVTLDSYLDTSIELSMNLFNTTDGEASPKEIRTISNSQTAHMRHYLPAGNYAVKLYENGHDDFSPTSYYSISVADVDSSISEVNGNDTTGAAAFTTGVISGSIDYYEDIDWYRIDPDSAAGNISVLDFKFSTAEYIIYELALYSSASLDTPLFVRNFNRVQGTSLMATIKLDDSADYYFSVKAASGADVDENKPYTLTVTTTTVADADDADGKSNDNDSSATILPQTAEYNGKIAFRGDVDWYTFTVPAGDNQIISLYLDIPATPNVEYGIDIKNNDGDLIKRLTIPSDDRKAVDLKTSLQLTSTTDTTYKLKVYDMQNDDSDTDAYYKISWDVDTANSPASPGTYFSETAEEAATASTVEIQYQTDNGAALSKATYNVNTTQFTMSNGTQETTNPDEIVVTFPWATGYIDYQGDEDWYALDLRSIPTGQSPPLNSEWYYTISLEMNAAASPVEFTLELLPDSDGNGKVNGIQAAIYDDDTSDDAIDLNLTSNKDLFTPPCIWVGSGDPTPASAWKGPMYLRVRDFNHIREPDNTLNDSPDDDWSVNDPYSFRVVLKYYPGKNHPDVDPQ